MARGEQLACGNWLSRSLLELLMPIFHLAAGVTVGLVALFLAIFALFLLLLAFSAKIINLFPVWNR